MRFETFSILNNSRTVGIHILEELDKKVDLFMHDSEHTQKDTHK